MPCDRRARVMLLAAYIALVDAALRAADPPAAAPTVGPNDGFPLLSRPPLARAALLVRRWYPASTL